MDEENTCTTCIIIQTAAKFSWFILWHAFSVGIYVWLVCVAVPEIVCGFLKLYVRGPL